MKKRIIPLLLALSLCLCVSALAADDAAYLRGNFSGLAVGPDDSLLVTDVYNKIVWQVSGDTAVPFAGAIPVADLSGEPEGVYRDGAADAAYFVEPWAIVPYRDGYAVSDAGAHAVRLIENGVVRTLAGGTAAFGRPTGLAVADDGTLYVADTQNGTIRAIGETGASSVYLRGLVSPTGLCWHDGALYIAETGLSRICKAENGTLQVVAGSAGAAESAGEYYGGYADGPVAEALFDHPQGVAVGSDGAVYVADSNNGAVRVIRNERVETIAALSEDSRLPLLPRTPLLGNGTLRVSDLYGGGILALPLGTAFSDVPAGEWYVDAVNWAAGKGVMNGVGGNLFAPEEPATRATAVAMLWRLAGSPDAPRSAFADVESGSWYEAAVNWAADAGVVLGGDDAAFHPDEPVTREQLAAMLYRCAQTRDMGFRGLWSFPLRYPDAARVSPFAYEAMCWMTMQGVVNGMGDGTLSPGACATRAQVVVLMQRFCEKTGL